MLAHIDGDAFFASVEQAINPTLKGRPVVTGKERNIVAAASYEAKALGISRGVSLWDARKMCKDLVVLPTDYETVSIFSQRIYGIIRRFTPRVEEYSIDEAFADLSGTERYSKASYELIGRRIQETIRAELDITVTVGIAPTKTLCKIAAKKGKPAGLRVIRQPDINNELLDVDVEDIWNIGHATASLLRKYHITTALQFKQKSRNFIRIILSKPGVQTWMELNGAQAIEFEQTKMKYQSIQKHKTFTPPSNSKEYVFAQLMKNLENACMKARRYNQGAKIIGIYTRTKEFKGLDAKKEIERATAYPSELASTVRVLFEEIWKPGMYRATGVYLAKLESTSPIQQTLFENPELSKKLSYLYGAIDKLRTRYGKHTVHVATTLPSQKSQHLFARGDIPKRKESLLKGESRRRRLPLPLIQMHLH